MWDQDLLKSLPGSVCKGKSNHGSQPLASNLTTCLLLARPFLAWPNQGSVSNKSLECGKYRAFLNGKMLNTLFVVYLAAQLRSMACMVINTDCRLNTRLSISMSFVCPNKRRPLPINDGIIRWTTAQNRPSSSWKRKPEILHAKCEPALRGDAIKVPTGQTRSMVVFENSAERLTKPNSLQPSEFRGNSSNLGGHASRLANNHNELDYLALTFVLSYHLPQGPV